VQQRCSGLPGLCVQICLACVFRSAWLVFSDLPGLCNSGVQVCLACVFRSAWIVCSDLLGLCVQICLVCASGNQVGEDGDKRFSSALTMILQVIGCSLRVRSCILPQVPHQACLSSLSCAAALWHLLGVLFFSEAAVWSGPASRGTECWLRWQNEALALAS